MRPTIVSGIVTGDAPDSYQGVKATTTATATKTAEKQYVWIRKTTTLHVHHAFLYISLPSLHDYDVKRPNLTFCVQRELKVATFIIFCQLRNRPLEFTFRKIRQLLTN